MDEDRDMWYEIRRMIREEMRPHKKKVIGFSVSKMLLFFITLSYFVGLFAGLFFIWHTINETPEYTVQALIALFSYIGGATAITIAFYSWKAKNENMNKYGNTEE